MKGQSHPIGKPRQSNSVPFEAPWNKYPVRGDFRIDLETNATKGSSPEFIVTSATPVLVGGLFVLPDGIAFHHI